MVEHTQQRATQDEDEISLVDIIRFFSRNGKFIALITVGLSAIAIPLTPLQPKQYQKQLTLLVKPTSVPLSNPLTTFPTMDINQVGALAVKFLQNPKLENTTAEPKYDPLTQQIDLTLRSPSASSLTDAGTKVVNQLETSFGTILGRSLETSQTSIEIEIKRNRQILGQLQQQKTQFSPTNQFRLGAIEPQQAQMLTNIAQLEFDRQYLEQAQKNLTEFTAQVISVQILSESDIPPQTRSPIKVMVVAVIASFLVAVLAATIRDQISRLKDELSRSKIKPSQDV